MCSREFENNLTQKYHQVIGIDEAGAGCLAGPVTVCACYWPKNISIPGIDDSKKLTPKKREMLFTELNNHPEIKYTVVHIDNKTIDQINILQSRFRGMYESYRKLKDFLPDIDCVLIDGDRVPPQFEDHDPNLNLECVVGGDGLCPSIAAASIIAKYSRDQLMSNEYHNLYPNYGFDHHKGYGTAEHIKKIQIYKPCPIHRLTFKHVKPI